MNRSGDRDPPNEQVREEAAQWLVAFSEGDVRARGREEFIEWLRRSPDHVRAYLRVSALWEDDDLFRRCRKLDVETLVRRAVEEGNVVSLNDGETKRDREIHAPHRHGTRFAVAAGILLLAVGTALVTWLRVHGASVYETAVGESRTITLADGSTIALNARSRVAVRYSESKRFIELLEGQALFRVAKNPSRPFIVRSGLADIRAVGTEFDVHRGPEGTVVTVVEGRIAVETPETDQPHAVLVSAGEQLVTTRDTLSVPKRANVANVTAWMQGKIVVESTPLREVIDEFNRHGPRQLVIDDRSLDEVRISGNFAFADATQFVQFLSQRFSLTVYEDEEEIRLTRE